MEIYSSQSCHVRSFMLERDGSATTSVFSVVERCSFWLVPLLTQKLLSNSAIIAGDKFTNHSIKLVPSAAQKRVYFPLLLPELLEAETVNSQQKTDFPKDVSRSAQGLFIL